MHLLRLKVASYRNLKDFEITFTAGVDDPDVEGGRRTFNSHAVIGANGAGKSNMIEAIITIFRDLDLNETTAFDYELDYGIRGHRIELKGNAGKLPSVSIDGQPAHSTRLSKEAREFLPSNVFVYYSGKNERIEKLFQHHQQRFNERMEITAEEYLPEQLLTGYTGQEAQARAIADHKRREDRRRERLGEDQLRRLFYCRGGHGQLVLLACLLSKDEAFTTLLQDLSIVELDSALFVLKQPHRFRQKLSESQILEGDKRFWYARGDVVDEFLDKLWQLAIAPIQHIESKLIDFRGRKEKQEQLFLFLPSKEKLRELGELVGDAERFFRYAEAAYIGDLIDTIQVNVKHRDAEGNISFDQLSEGELQILTVLGLMRITSHDHCLFLLDEPDTHLNPLWKLRYFDGIEAVIRKNAAQTVAGDSQIIITTHDPMMIGSLRREQVRILRKQHGCSVVETPAEHPQGMGVAGLLKSEMFGLQSTLDNPTLRMLEERNDLIARKAKEGLGAAEEDRLKRLRARLDDLGFSRENRDPLYQIFIQKMHEARAQPLSELLIPEELARQERLAGAVASELVKKERTEDLSALARELKVLVEE
jgi:predicted ATPase